MKLCGRIDIDVALMQYRHHLSKAEQVARVTSQTKRKRRMAVKDRDFGYWRRRLADAAR